MTTDLSELDSNQIISQLDELLGQGYSINDIVSTLDGVRIIANYDRLAEKGATNIDLAAIRDVVHPIVIMNNLAVFQKEGVPIDTVKMAYGLLDSDGFDTSPYDVKKWTQLGADPQILADKYVDSHGFDIKVIQTLLDLGAKVDAEKLIENLLNDEDYLIENFYTEKNIEVLKLTGASDESIHRLLKRISELTIEDEMATYGGPYPEKLDINESGAQTTKIFFVPQIQVMSPRGGYELEVDWAGRVLPGQTINDGIATGIKEVYGYTGKFEWRSPYFKDWTKDNQGNDIQRFGLYITLYPSGTDQLPYSV